MTGGDDSMRWQYEMTEWDDSIRWQYEMTGCSISTLVHDAEDRERWGTWNTCASASPTTHYWSYGMRCGHKTKLRSLPMCRRTPELGIHLDQENDMSECWSWRHWAPRCRNGCGIHPLKEEWESRNCKNMARKHTTNITEPILKAMNFKFFLKTIEDFSWSHLYFCVEKKSWVLLLQHTI